MTKIRLFKKINSIKIAVEPKNKEVNKVIKRLCRVPPLRLDPSTAFVAKIVQMKVLCRSCSPDLRVTIEGQDCKKLGSS